MDRRLGVEAEGAVQRAFPGESGAVTEGGDTASIAETPTARAATTAASRAAAKGPW